MAVLCMYIHTGSAIGSAEIGFLDFWPSRLEERSGWEGRSFKGCVKVVS